MPSVQVLPGPLPEGPGVVPCLVRVAQAEIKPDAMNVNELRQRSGAMYGTPLQQANEHLAQRYGVPLDSLCNSHGLWPSVVP